MITGFIGNTLGSLGSAGCGTNISSIVSNLLPGTVITLTGKSGLLYGPGTFQGFDSATNLITLQESTGISPASTTITRLDAGSIESISYSV